jgi:hypothetical protein
MTTYQSKMLSLCSNQEGGSGTKTISAGGETPKTPVAETPKTPNGSSFLFNNADTYAVTVGAGGTGGSFVHKKEEFDAALSRGLQASQQLRDDASASGSEMHALGAEEESMESCRNRSCELLLLQSLLMLRDLNARLADLLQRFSHLHRNR